MPRTRWAEFPGRDGIEYDTDTLREILLLAIVTVCALAQSSLERAVTLAREGRFAEARDLLKDAAEPAASGQRIAFHRLKAAVALGLGEASNAADEMEKALALAPADPGLLLGAAAAELQAERFDDALRHARAAGNTAEAHALAGDIQERMGAYVEAAKAYQAAVALAPDREQYRIALALELVQHYTFEPAIAVLEQAAPLFPKSARIRTLLGIAEYAVGSVDAAQQALLDAIAIDPKLAPAYEYLAKFTLESSAAPPARVSATLCGWSTPLCGALKLRAARASGDKVLGEAAVTDLKRAPAGNAVARCELGRAYEWFERWAEARVEMEGCVKLEPSPQNHYRLSRIYSRLGLADLARTQMDLRNQAAEHASEEVARREAAVQAFQVLK